MREEYSLDALNFSLANVRQESDYCRRRRCRDRRLDPASLHSSFVLLAGSQAAADAAAAFFGPAIAAITLGIMGPRAFTRRIGRNESFNHAGNSFAAALAGVCAWMWGPIVVFYLVASMALLLIVSVLTIRAEAIDYDLARGLHAGLSESQEIPSGLSALMSSRAS